jgi:iron-sulfur cluster repair protein YtfE (RIC family)
MSNDMTSSNFEMITDHIIRFHHQRTRQYIHIASVLMSEIKSDRQAMSLAGLDWKLHTFITEIRAHLDHEEVVLFPACVGLDLEKGMCRSYVDPMSLMQIIHTLSEGHSRTFEALSELIYLSHTLDFARSPAVGTLESIFQDLREDLGEHGRLEEEVLLPAILHFQMHQPKENLAKSSGSFVVSREMVRL